jgi:two-component system CheB/CheR fusion protein
VLDARHQILHCFGEPERFLTVHSGPASLSVLKLVPRALSLALSSALRRAVKEQKVIRFAAVPLPGLGTSEAVDLKVEPLVAESGQTGVMLVFFQKPQKLPAPLKSQKFNPSSESVGHITELEDDLESAKKELQAAIEDKDTAQEELQATNEELLAGNEELQSSNEELESVNEELTTLNAEYQQKIAELIVVNNDLENFLRTSDVATIFLDDAMRLRRFTPAVIREIQLRPHDLGRLLTDFAHPLIAAIAGDLPRVAASGKAMMKTVETGRKGRHLVRVTPYRREGASDRGLVVTLLDVSGLQLGEVRPEKSGCSRALDMPRDLRCR